MRAFLCKNLLLPYTVVGDVRHGLWKLIWNFNSNHIVMSPPWYNGRVLDCGAKGFVLESHCRHLFSSQITTFMQKSS